MLSTLWISKIWSDLLRRDPLRGELTAALSFLIASLRRPLSSSSLNASCCSCSCRNRMIFNFRFIILIQISTWKNPYITTLLNINVMLQIYTIVIIVLKFWICIFKFWQIFSISNSIWILFILIFLYVPEKKNSLSYQYKYFLLLWMIIATWPSYSVDIVLTATYLLFSILVRKMCNDHRYHRGAIDKYMYMDKL